MIFNKLKSLLRKIIPRTFLNLYHGLVNYFFGIIYKFPSKKIIVIGITGTKGKTTTSYLIYQLLKGLGYSVCLINSDFEAINEDIQERKERLTMPGRGYLQKFLARAVKANCEIAIIEVTSEGLMQNRHWGIDFDIAVFLGLHPEHIEHHGGFLNYRNAKGKLFRALSKSKTRKELRGLVIKKSIIVNSDSKEAEYFLNFAAENKITFGLTNYLNPLHLKPNKIKYSSKGTSFEIDKIHFTTKLLGDINLYNTLAALGTLLALWIPIRSAKDILRDFSGLPGHFEVIRAKKITIIIDYAHTPESLESVCKISRKLFEPKRLLLLIGAAGGHRDKWKRSVLGEIAITYANEVVITNEDPFDEDPMKIMEAIESGIVKYLREFDVKKPYSVIEDRGEAIKYLINKAQPGDLVLITGKGNEKEINFGQYKISWSDREEVMKALKKANI